MRVRYATINGAKTRYYDAGEGYPVILIHGVGSSADTWLRSIQSLSKDFRVIAMDLPGHGFTDRVAYEGAPQPVMIDHIVALADHLNLDKFTVCGSSYGAMLAMLIYFRLPKRAEKLILLSSASATLSDDERSESMKKAYNASVNAYKDPTFESVLQRMRNLFYNPDKIATELALIQLNIFSQPGMLGNFEQLMKGMMDLDAGRPYRVDHRFGEIKAPMLMLWGLKDKQVDPARARGLAKQAADAYFVGVDDCGHIPHLEQPDQVNSLIASFLKGESMQQYKA